MIGSLRGTLLDRDAKGNVVIEVNGVGYEVQVTGPTVARMGEPGTEVFVRVHTRVREDAITLFGFATAEEKRCFDALIGAHGVGPAVALALLTAHSPQALRHIIALEDADALAQTPGIGKKTAARMIVELKSKFEVDFDDELVDIAGSSPQPVGASSARADVTAALTGLGYAGDEIRAVLQGLSDETGAEDMLRRALRDLAVKAS